MRTGKDAVAYARRYSQYKSQYCLNFVQTVLGAPWSGPSAVWAWNNAKHKHGPDPHPPAGAPVWFLGSRYGHIALSVGGGKVRSTDWPRAGRSGQMAPVGEVEIATLARTWGRKYAGWAEDLGGQKIPGLTGTTPSKPPTPPKEWDEMASKDEIRSVVREEIHKAFDTYDIKLPVGYSDQKKPLPFILAETMNRTRALVAKEFGTPDIVWDGDTPKPKS